MTGTPPLGDRRPSTCLSIAVPSKDAFHHFVKDPRPYVATQARRQRIEVSYKKLDDEDKANFDAAMKKEVDQTLLARACRGVIRSKLPDVDLMKMRRVPTWKDDPNETNGG
eukprot:7218393-Pyramimonas_sp.AAC.1